jgi:hypothetical protein
MTEVVASLIGIATFGIKLTTTLYEFGANAASAREQTDRIARHLRLYSEVLEVLVDRIDDGEPIHSAKALSLVDEIYDQSYDLFDNIKDLIPKKGDRMSFMRKIAWNFKKSRVALVVSEIEYLKSTVTLLVTVLFAGKKIRSSRRKRRSKNDSKKDREEVDLECAKVKIAIVEQINASAHKLNMQAKVEEEERKKPVTKHENKERALTRPRTGILQHSMEIVNFRESLGQTEDQGEERALVLNHSSNLIANLLDQWTTLADDATSYTVNQGKRGSGNLRTSKVPQNDQTSEGPAPVDDYQQGEAASGKISDERKRESSREEKHRAMLTEAYLDVRNRAERAEEELARLKASLPHPEESTIRNQGGASGSRSRRTTYTESRLSEESDRHQPKPPPRPGGEDSPRDRISSPSHVPRTRADADMDEQHAYPKSERHAEDHTGNTDMRRPPPSVKGEWKKNKPSPLPERFGKMTQQERERSPSPEPERIRWQRARSRSRSCSRSPSPERCITDSGRERILPRRASTKVSWEAWGLS